MKTAPSPTVDLISEIRSHFPALARKHNGRPVAYFDGPGGTQVPRSVVDSIVDYLYNHNANTGWAYPTSVETNAAVDAARLAVADFLNARPDEIAFGANMTTLTFHLARALGRNWGPGDEVIVTELDHHANVDSWLRLAAERGVTVKFVRMIPETGQLDYEHLESLLSSRTKIVAIGAASNAIGTISDIPRTARLAHDAGALVFVDAVHYAPHELVDVQALGCDFLGCSAYKFYGPHIGFHYVRRDLFENIDYPRLQPASQTPPDRSETGTQNHEGIVGAGAAVDFLASFGSGNTRRERLQSSFSVLHNRGMELVAQLWNGLSTIKGVTLYGPPPDKPRTPTVSFNIEGMAAREVATKLVDSALFLSSGGFYAHSLMPRLGLQGRGLVRAGCACYATAEEVDRLISAVEQIAAK